MLNAMRKLPWNNFGSFNTFWLRLKLEYLFGTKLSRWKGRIRGRKFSVDDSPGIQKRHLVAWMNEIAASMMVQFLTTFKPLLQTEGNCTMHFNTISLYLNHWRQPRSLRIKSNWLHWRKSNYMCTLIQYLVFNEKVQVNALSKVIL